MTPPKSRKKRRITNQFPHRPVVSPITSCCGVTLRLLSVFFRSDHLDSAGKKLIKRPVSEHVFGEQYSWDATSRRFIRVDREFDSLLGDQFTEFSKPEWSSVRGGASDSHPISHTKNGHVVVDLEFEATVLGGGTVNIGTIQGTPATGHGYLAFEKRLNKPVKDQEKIMVTGLTSRDKLPNFVALVEDTIRWTAVVNGTAQNIGTSGSHKIYVTFDTPGGKMESPRNNAFQESGADQVVTESRLGRSVEWAKGTGIAQEKECVDRIFQKLEIGYFLGRRWVFMGNTTGMDPKPTLHHYLWCCNVDDAKGECHNIAASFALACKILGVKGHFEVGYMFPWPSRNESAPLHPKRGDQILGRYNVRYNRTHTEESHGSEYPNFLDGTNRPNNFEGVARYNNALYAIGDARFDLHSDADANASCYFAKFDSSPDGGITNSDRSVGRFTLVFTQPTVGYCPKPYPWSTGPRFKWHD